jgi:myo-inositol 2-dehydrogenase/D-chiro-inositol 1-dehydrogenase
VTEAIAWVDAVLDDKPMPVPLRSSLTGLVIAKALQESLRTGKKIEFDGRSFQYKLRSRL